MSDLQILKDESMNRAILKRLRSSDLQVERATLTNLIYMRAKQYKTFQLFWNEKIFSKVGVNFPVEKIELKKDLKLQERVWQCVLNSLSITSLSALLQYQYIKQYTSWICFQKLAR